MIEVLGKFTVDHRFDWVRYWHPDGGGGSQAWDGGGGAASGATAY